MMNITARQDTVRMMIDILSVLVEEARFNFKDNHLEIRVVDPSHVAMIRMEVDSAAFEAWDVDETSLGLELAPIGKLIGLAVAGDLLEINYDEGVGLVSIQVGEINRTIRPLDRQAMVEPKVPEIPLDSCAILSGTKFARALRAADQVGDLVTFSLDKNQFVVHVSGDGGAVTVPYEAGELLGLECAKPVKSQYSLQYLLPLATRISSTVEEVKICFGENYPLQIEFEFAEGSGRVIYFLAPRVEGDT